MEKIHRETIQKSYATLVQQCNIDILIPVLVQKNVFSSEMVPKYMNINEDQSARKRLLFLDIQMRGPKAFTNLISALRQTGQTYLANLLDPMSNGNTAPKRHAKPFILPACENTEEIQILAENADANALINLNTQPLRIKVELSKQFLDNGSQRHVPVYSTHSKNRGMVLIINVVRYKNNLYDERKGADVDGRNLYELFTQIGLRVDMHVDLTGNQIKETILNFKASPNLAHVDMAFIILMAHGDQDKDVTNIIGSDNYYVSTNWIEEQFDNAHCKVLQKKPKIIMYQTCRGKSADYGVAVSHRIQTDSTPCRVTLRTREDMLIAHSTLPGDASHRDIYVGAWYIQIFCETMMNHAHDHHIEEIFKLVDSRLAHLRSSKETMQTAMFLNQGFNKHCYVHPGIYLEDGRIKSISDDSVVV